MCIKMMYNIITIYLRMYSNIKWESSTMQNHNFFCINLMQKKYIVWLHLHKISKRGKCIDTKNRLAPAWVCTG